MFIQKGQALRGPGGYAAGTRWPLAIAISNAHQGRSLWTGTTKALLGSPWGTAGNVNLFSRHTRTIAPFRIPLSCYHQSYGLWREKEELFDIIDDISETDSASEYVEKKKKETKFLNYKKWDIELVTQILKELKGTDVVVIDTANKSNWVQYMVYVTGRSGSHLLSMANALADELKFRKRGTFSIDHKDCDFWVIVNSGDILINLFTEEAREEYDLERTWVLRREPSFVYGEQEDVMKELKFVYDEEDGVYEEVFESARDKENYTGKGSNEKIKKVYRDKDEKRKKKKIVIIPPVKSKKPAKKVQTKT